MATGLLCTELEKGRCPICLETLRGSMTLPCQHTFCKTCISQYIHSKENETKRKVPIYSCPVCRTDLTSEKQEFEKKTEKGMEPETKFDCGPCKERGKDTRAIKWCRDCQEPFCEICTLEHKSFKCSKNHEVSSLEEMRGQKDVRYLDNFSDNCPVHPEYLVEAYCFNHGQLCCISCFMTTHRKCDNTNTIKELVDTSNDNSNTNVVSFESDLSKIETATDELLQEKKTNKSQVEQAFLDIEDSVNTTVQKIKDNLDTLMISFRKELHLKQDDYEAKVDPSIKDIETLKETIANAKQNIEFVRNYKTSIQLFIYLEKTKEEIKKMLEERIKPTLTSSKLEIRFNLEDAVQQIEQLSNLGRVEFLESTERACSSLRSQMNESFCNFLNFDNMTVKRRDKIISICGFAQCGTSVDDTTIVVPCGKMVNVVDIVTSKIVKEYETHAGGNQIKRLSYEKGSMFFVYFVLLRFLAPNKV